MKTYNEFLNEKSLFEGKWSKIMKGVKASENGGPWTVVAIDSNTKKVVAQNHVTVRDAIPASYEDIKRRFPKARINIEDSGGMGVYNESIVNESNSSDY